MMLKLLLVFLTGLMLVLQAEGQVCVSPECSICNSTKALCTGNKCPRDLPVSITDLTLIGGKCGEFRSGIFKNQLNSLHNIQFLTLTNCNIRIMWGAPFRPNQKLVKLNLHNNMFQEVTNETFGGLKALEILSLLRNGIRTIKDSAFGDLGSLVTLDLKLNKLTSFSETVADGLYNLETLDLSYNKISHLDSLHTLKSLTSINLQHNLLQNIPNNLFINPNLLTVIDLNTNMISSLDNSILKGTSLERLDLSSNMFSSVPNLRACKAPPRNLILKNNTIKSIKPEDFSQMEITTLDLSSNPIDNIPEDCFQNSHITYLNLKSTNLNWLPETMSLLTDQGTSLELDGGNWRCECDQLWLGRYLQSTGKLAGPSCGSGKHSGQHFKDIVADLEFECQTTTTDTLTTTISTIKTTTALQSSHATKLSSTMTFKVTTTEKNTRGSTGNTIGTTDHIEKVTSDIMTTRMATTLPSTLSENGSIMTKSVNTIDSRNTTNSYSTSTDQGGEESNTAPLIAGLVCALLLLAAVITGLVLWKKKVKITDSMIHVEPAESVSGYQKVDIEDPVSTQQKSDIKDPMSTQQKSDIKDPVSKEQKTDIKEPMSTQQKCDIKDPVSKEQKPDIKEPMSKQQKCDNKDLKFNEQKAEDPDVKSTDQNELLKYKKNDLNNKNIDSNDPVTRCHQIDKKTKNDPLQTLRNFPSELTFIDEGPELARYPHGQIDGPYRVQFKPKMRVTSIRYPQCF